MSISVSQFLNDLYDEHVEEAAFLYDFVLESITEPDFQWIEAREFEARREAHIDALTIGDSAALLRCQNLASDGAGELYVYASVIVRQGRVDQLAERMATLNLRDRVSLDALTCAMTEHAELARLNSMSANKLDTYCNVTLLAMSRAIDRLGGTEPQIALKQVLQARLGKLQLNLLSDDKTSADTEDDVSVALFATVANGEFKDAHFSGLLSDDDCLVQDSIFNIQNYGDTSEISRLRQAVKDREEGHAAIMTAAGADYVQTLIADMKKGGSQDTIQALAISGLAEAVRPLVNALDSDDMAEVAATALYCLTGAELLETIFEEELVDEDTLFDEEREAFKEGEKPTRPDGSNYGEERERISIDPERWKQWLMSNKAQFVAGTRYRFGEPITPDSLVRALRREQTPSWLRVHTEQELRCRYGVTAPFDISMTVQQQLPCLLNMRQSLSTLQGIVPGKWYFAGQLMRSAG